MLMSRHAGAIITILLLAGLATFLLASMRQRQVLNLSATAGGQMPYLVYADRIAREGLMGHFGDRNRMPAIPAIASLLHSEDWEIFHQRSSALAVALSTGLIIGVWWLVRRLLSPWPSAAFAMIVAVAVILPQSSFLQADVPFYTLCFLTWLAMLRLIDRPGVAQAALVGTLIGMTYLVKASILLSVPILVGVLILRGAFSGSRGKPFFVSAAIAPAAFLLLVSPYLMNNYERFGRVFYNVNTTFFVWCDSWSEAQQFAERYQIDRQFPDAPADQIPGPVNYLRTHSARQIAQRLGYGIRTLFGIMLDAPAFKYLAILFLMVLVVSIRNGNQKEWIRRYNWQIALTLALLLAYGLAYSWYVLIAYGDRFVLSLVPLVLFVFLHFLDRSGKSGSAKLHPVTVVSVILVILCLADGIRASIAPQPAREFVRFYYDETREEFRRGNLAEARRGFEGIVALDPGFAAAHRELGMIALAENRLDDAVESLSRAAVLEPDWGDVQNTLGAALLQSGRLAEAVPVLERAVELDPASPPAWYNLCGALFRIGDRQKASQCLSRLETLSPDLAARIRNAFPTSNTQESNP